MPHKFHLFDAVLMAVVVVMVVEAITPAAAIGPAQFFWWGFLMVFFFVPYGLIASELGTTYPEAGGLYVWVRNAFGQRFGGRAAWLYWVNFPIWLASMAILFVDSYTELFHVHVPAPVMLLVELAFVWGVVVVGNWPVAESKLLINAAAFAKMLLVIVLGVMGVYALLHHGMATKLTVATMLPHADMASLSKLSIIIFNFLGFEVVASMAPHMQNPRKQIPQALLLGGVLIMVFYLLAAFGISAALPTKAVSGASGLIQSLVLLLQGQPLIVIGLGLLFMFTLFVEMVSWIGGVNSVATQAALDKALPQAFAATNAHGQSVGAGRLTGLLASLICVVMVPLANTDAFTPVFTLNVVALLMAYLLMFPAFLKLRQKDPNAKRPFKVGGNRLVLTVMAVIPELLLLATLVFTLLAVDSLVAGVILWGGTFALLVIGEIVVRHQHLVPVGAPQPTPVQAPLRR